MGTLKAQLEYMEETRRLVEWNAMCTGAKGGDKMAKVPAWLLLILNFLMSDLFDQLLEWAKDIIGEEDVRSQEDKDARRSLAVVKLRAEASVNGFKVTRWQAGQAVEAAYAEAFPWKTKAPEA